MWSVLVTKTYIAQGSKIKEEDVKEIRIKTNRIKSKVVYDKDKIFGLEAKKTLKEGKLVFEREVGAPLFVRKGNIVTAIYKVKGLQITSKVEALEDGASGQRIYFVNLKSGKKLKAKIIDAETVEIENE